MTSRIDYAYSPLKMDSTRQLNLRLLADDRSPQGNYKFNQMRKTSYIATDQDSVNDNKLFSLGEISDVGICYAKIPYGAGTIFMHSIPYVFTNYNMLKADNQEYISKSCSFFDVNNIIWDEYYKPDKNLYKASTLSVLLGYKSFKWAYWISIGTLVLFFIFRTKREQRMIPIISPFQNSSEEFSKTISGLFYEHASNKEIALKKIRLFKEYLHQQYYLGDFEFSEEEASVLSFKSGKSLKELEKLFFSISRIEKSAIVSNPELLDFSDQLNRFLDRK